MRAERDWEGPEDQTLPGRGRSSSSVESAIADSLITSRATAPAFTPSPGTPGEGWGEGTAFTTNVLLKSRAVWPSPLPSPSLPGEGEYARAVSISGRGSRFFFCAADA